MVQGQRVKGQGHSVRNSQHRFTLNMSRFLLIYRVRASSICQQRACALSIVGRSAPHGGCQAHFAKRPKTIFSNQTRKRAIAKSIWHIISISGFFGLFGLKILFSDVLQSAPGNRHVEPIRPPCAMRVRVVGGCSTHSRGN